MKKTLLITSGILASFGIGMMFNPMLSGKYGSLGQESSNLVTTDVEKPLKLGAFSLSLNVKDLEASKSFYETLGFQVSGGSMNNNYLILRNGNAIIGIFKGMFEGNMMTFNPGWDESAKNTDPFDDVREIQKRIKAKGLMLTMEADEKTAGPAYLMLNDPDGNVILIDQHR